MAYRFAPASSAYIEISPGPFVGYAMRAAGAPWSCYALINRNGLATWQGIVTINDGAGTPAAYYHFLEFSPGNNLVGDDSVFASWTSTETFTSTTEDTILGMAFAGTDNVVNNARYDFKKGAAAWGSENETIDLGGNGTTVGSGYRIRIGNNHDLGDDGDFDLVCLGLIKSQLSQGTVQSLSQSSFSAWQSVFTGTGAILLRFDDIAARNDVNGNGANETARSASGITVVADPSGFFGGTGATVTNVPADGTGAFPAPSLSTGSTVTTPAADATGDFPDDMPLSVSVTTDPADALGDFPIPAVSGTGDATVTTPPADGLGDFPVPAFATGSSVTTPAADATGDLPNPAFQTGATVTNIPADAAGDFPVPTQVGAPVVRVRTGNRTTGATEVTARQTGANEPAHTTGAAEPAHTTGAEAVLNTTGAAEVALVA
jgi:hypothetical protein